MSKLSIGIVGAGMIAGVIANAIKQSASATTVAVASRRMESAKAFAQEHEIVTVFEHWEDLVASAEIDAVYVATPTASKEDIAIAAARHGKHILVDKPYASLDSVTRMIDAANQHNVGFMDATHFSNHPRTRNIRESVLQSIGHPQAIRTSFFFPFMDRSNIRFNPALEPTGAVGDMAWYSMRAIAEFLAPDTDITHISGSIVRDEETDAVVRGAGLVAFADGKTSTFDFGYNAGVCLMDLDILGQQGMLHLDDFVLDWKHGFAFDNQDHIVGYTRRSGMQQPREFEYIAADTDTPQAVHMINNFAAIAAEPHSDASQHAQLMSLKTQELLDAYWLAVSA